jgi:hypothetical protein
MGHPRRIRQDGAVNDLIPAALSYDRSRTLSGPRVAERWNPWRALTRINPRGLCRATFFVTLFWFARCYGAATKAR